MQRSAPADSPPPPAAAVAAARAAASDTAAGARLRVILLTVGQGDRVFERYGHNLLWISDTLSGEGTVWEWGLFDFNQPKFISRFLFGNTSYSMGRWDAASVLAHYKELNREVVGQELALTAAQRAALDAYVRTHWQEEHRNYRYDYYLDNCSTRLRDALDVVLDGALSGAFRGAATPWTYRSETLRLNQHSGWLFAGLDLALGAPADRPISLWGAAFVPMRLRDALRDVMVPGGPDGAMRPLVIGEATVVRVERPDEPTQISSAAPRLAVLGGGLLLAGVIALLALRGSAGAGVRVALALGAAVHAVLGLAALLLVFMWLFTRHDFWAWNAHLFLMTPVSLLAAGSLARAAGGRPVGAWLVYYHLAITALGFVTGIVATVADWRNAGAGPGMLSAWAGASWLLHSGVLIVLRARALAAGGGAGPAPAGAATAAVRSAA